MICTPLVTIALLILSNVFMTLAWYGHLRFVSVPLWLVVVGSWGVAFFEYCFQVPANRFGYQIMSAYQLKTLQEIITLTVFIVFAELYLGEASSRNRWLDSPSWRWRHGPYFKTAMA